jgi:transaldolase / glucose-6-phosphate isomerase
VTLLSGSKGNGKFDWADIRKGIKPGDYVAICAYVQMNAEHVAALDKLRLAFRDKLQVATTVGFGPRFLHSTGQLHKGGPNTVYMIQITTHDPNDPPIPGMNVGFRTLIAAQALGDFQSLEKRDRRGLRVKVKDHVDQNLPLLVDTIIDGCFGLATR